MHLEAGSFRDRRARILYDDRGRVLRGLSPHALEQWQALAATKFFREAVAAGRMVRSELVGDSNGDWAGLLEHERVPFVSYPYEWCFGMLRDAALLQIERLDGQVKLFGPAASLPRSRQVRRAPRSAGAGGGDGATE